MPEHAIEHSAAERPSTIPWPPILLAGAIAAAWWLGWAVPIEWTGMDDWPARLVGYGIGIGGILLMAWGIVALRRAGTTVLPDSPATRLVTSGPYRRYRNPIYLADVMILLGLAELTHNIWFAPAAAAFVALVTWLAILPEERHLEAVFGDEYRAYKAASRRWL
jgi:protein-S-isoprenylcysteine O-methyltransferase Ste14